MHPGEGKTTPELDVGKAMGPHAGPVDVTVTPQEHPDERAHRHRMEQVQQKHTNCLEIVLTTFGVVLVSAILLFSMGIVVFESEPEVRKNGFSAVVAVLTCVLGFVAGKATARKPREG